MVPPDIHISQAIVSVLSKLPSKLTLECKHKKRSEQNWQAACVISFLVACCSIVQGKMVSKEIKIFIVLRLVLIYESYCVLKGKLSYFDGAYGYWPLRFTVKIIDESREIV